MAINQIAKTGLSSLQVIYYFESLFIPFVFQVAALLATLTHPGHIVSYAPRDSFPCRRTATRNPFGID
ncbi:hypothetical protein XBKB1_360010 [Xenorhabdus bovienii str. kraussei Becker Underwood]|uniref:Uncharacterized protein n=1 Tax=Xenorhabdus bovienii str. kraussei Becker Underwood TaxID=1398204 RepID=A0A077PWI1_XENBV|nr:hypothetical protein XBKB1_360010 [Xenorhabdus bovienii str. kraussei Becker Underwood]